MRLLQILFFTLSPFLVFDSSAQREERVTRPVTIGESFEIYSDELGENRTIHVYLPQEYSKDSLRRYHVLYLLDGSLDEDFIHIAGLVQFATFPWINYLPPTIVVGIENIDRKKDFTFPSGVATERETYPTTGHSASFIRFLENELIPYISEQYSADSLRTIIGQSLGGLLTTEILSKKPHLFSRYIIVSPSLWWSDGAILEEFPAVPSSRKIYLAVGEEGKRMIEPCGKLREKLESGHDLRFRFFADNDHGNILHIAVYDAFLRLFEPVE